MVKIHKQNHGDVHIINYMYTDYDVRAGILIIIKGERNYSLTRQHEHAITFE